MPSDILSVLERAMKSKEPGGSTFSGRTSTDASVAATQPMSRPGHTVPVRSDVDGEATHNERPAVRRED